MRNFLFCRRTFIATLAIGAMTVIGCYVGDVDACYAIASVAVSLAAANAYEGASKSKDK